MTIAMGWSHVLGSRLPCHLGPLDPVLIGVDSDHPLISIPVPSSRASAAHSTRSTKSGEIGSKCRTQNTRVSGYYPVLDAERFMDEPVGAGSE
jgi:hypothetical protein